MTLATNNNFANCELSSEDLEAIAAGWPHWMHSAANAVGRAIEHTFTDPTHHWGEALAVSIGWSALAVGAVVVAA
jgi:hypothetical protein